MQQEQPVEVKHARKMDLRATWRRSGALMVADFFETRQWRRTVNKAPRQRGLFLGPAARLPQRTWRSESLGGEDTFPLTLSKYHEFATSAGKATGR